MVPHEAEILDGDEVLERLPTTAQAFNFTDTIAAQVSEDFPRTRLFFPEHMRVAACSIMQSSAGQKAQPVSQMHSKLAAIIRSTFIAGALGGK